MTADRLVAAARAAGVADRRVLDAVAAVPRSAFVPAELAGRADLDRPLPIPHGQVTTQPSLVARMVEALELTGDERVLEVGTGYGWQTALLARLARLVWSIERWDDLAAAAVARLDRRGVRNVRVLTGDGTLGWPEAAPFDGILVAAAFPDVPRPLAEQLRDGGRLVQPIGRGGDDEVVAFRRESGRLVRDRLVTPARFVRLLGRHGFVD